MKYVDTEKLKGFEETLADIIVSSQGLCTYEACKDMAKEEALTLIASLQQEQPTNTDNLCSELADFLIRNDIQEEKAKFLANRILDLYGSKKYLEGLCDGIKQEQSGVDLEKEIDEWLKAGPITDTRYDDYCDNDIKETARHFYDLGLNARKKE